MDATGVVVNLPSTVTRTCNSTVKSGLENAINVEFDLAKADHASLKWIVMKGLMLVSGEVMRATTELTEKGKPNKDYDPDVETLLDFTRAEVIEAKYLEVDLDKYVAWKTMNRRAAKSEEQKEKELVTAVADKLVKKQGLSKDQAMDLVLDLLAEKKESA